MWFLVAGALSPGYHPAPTAQDVIEARIGCYDAALVGQIVENDAFEDLNDVFPDGDSIWLGGVYSVLVRKRTQLIGRSPKLGWAKIIVTSLPQRTVKLLLLTKTHSSGLPMVVHWTMLRKADAREVARELSDSPVARCS